jgi:hypothetical protein
MLCELGAFKKELSKKNIDDSFWMGNGERGVINAS